MPGDIERSATAFGRGCEDTVIFAGGANLELPIEFLLYLAAAGDQAHRHQGRECERTQRCHMRGLSNDDAGYRSSSIPGVG